MPICAKLKESGPVLEISDPLFGSSCGKLTSVPGATVAALSAASLHKSLHNSARRRQARFHRQVPEVRQARFRRWAPGDRQARSHRQAPGGRWDLGDQRDQRDLADRADSLHNHGRRHIHFRTDLFCSRSQRTIIIVAISLTIISVIVLVAVIIVIKIPSAHDNHLFKALYCIV